jgi:hypothetical protein
MSIFSNSQVQHNHKDFSINLDRSDRLDELDRISDELTIRVRFGGQAVELKPSIMYINPIKDLLRVAAAIHYASHEWDDPDRKYLSFEWEAEGPFLKWVFRPLGYRRYVRVTLTGSPNLFYPRQGDRIDTVIDADEFTRQVWEQAILVLRGTGLGRFGPVDNAHREFPFGDLIPVHELVTRVTVPRGLRAEIDLLKEFLDRVG